MDVLLGIVLLGVLVFVVARVQSRAAEKRRREQRARDAADAARLQECDEVVRYFANHHGYLARSVISREEIASLIDGGATGDDLRRAITQRMLGVSGIELGRAEDGYPVVLADALRDRHVYVIGKSGYGKTNFLRHCILQDLYAGRGLGVVAPEYELLTDELLPFIPESRIDDVIYFDPADRDRPVVLNPLHREPGDDIDLLADEAFTVLRRVLGEGGPRMDEILRHTLYALIERPGSTLLDVERLLDRQDDALRAEVVRTTQDERTRRFFASTYAQFPKESHLPITNRIGRIVGTKVARNCLCPPGEAARGPDAGHLLNIRRAMDEGKILLFNLSDGILGEAASHLIGQFIVSKFQTATMSRANVAKGERRPFYLYLDEFQNFCGTASASYEKILSRARKYRLGLILAHQQTGQLPPELLREVLGNVSTLVSFQLSQADAARLAREFIGEVDFEIAPLPPEELLRLGVGRAYCRIEQHAFPLRVDLVDAPPDYDRARRVIARSRELYGIPRGGDSAHREPSGGAADPLAGIDPGGVFE